MKQQQPFDPRPYCEGGLSSAEVIDMKETFDFFDDGTQTVSLRDLGEVLKSIAFDSKSSSLSLSQDPSLHQLMADVRLYGDKRVTFRDFLNIVTHRIGQSNDPGQEADRIERMFQLFDRRKVGKISQGDLREVLKEVGIDLPETKIAEMIQKANSNQDGEVSKQDFRRIMSRKI